LYKIVVCSNINASSLENLYPKPSILRAKTRPRADTTQKNTTQSATKQIKKNQANRRRRTNPKKFGVVVGCSEEEGLGFPYIGFSWVGLVFHWLGLAWLAWHGLA